MDEQEEINERASNIIKMLNGQNSSSCVLSMLTVIDAIAFSDKADDAFRVQTAQLLGEQSRRITYSMSIKSEAVN